MKNIRHLLNIFLVIILPKSILAQGCSDAGFCSAGALKPQEEADTLYANTFKFTVGYGIGEQGTAILQAIPEFEFSFFKNNTIQIKAPFSYVNGNLASTTGLGDITLSISQNLLRRSTHSLSFTLGGRIPSGNSNLKKDNLSLPMPYQLSLGTYDIIFGLRFQYFKWNLSTGFQGVLYNQNNNRFLKAEWQGNNDAQQYFESYKLKRSNDVLLRLERSFQLKKFYFSTGLLGIYRLERDRITELNLEEKVVSLAGSEGLTLNLTGGIQYLISTRSAISLSFGTPLLVREVRPDGLTRSVVINAAYQIRFGK